MSATTRRRRTRTRSPATPRRRPDDRLPIRHARSVHRIGRLRLAARLPLDRPRLGGPVEQLCRLWPGDLERDRRAAPDGRRPLHPRQEAGRAALLAQRQLRHQHRRVAAANGYAPLDKTWNRFNPMATLAYDVSDDVHALCQICDRLSRRRRQLAHRQLPGVRPGGRQVLRGRPEDRLLRPPRPPQPRRLHHGPQEQPGRHQLDPVDRRQQLQQPA